MKLFEIPAILTEGVQHHPDPYVKELWRLTIEIASTLNREERLHAELVQNARRESAQTAPGEIAPENSQIVPPRDDCREKLERALSILRNWRSAGQSHAYIRVEFHQITDLISVLEK